MRYTQYFSAGLFEQIGIGGAIIKHLFYRKIYVIRISIAICLLSYGIACTLGESIRSLRNRLALFDLN